MATPYVIKPSNGITENADYMFCEMTCKAHGAQQARHISG